MHVHVRMVCSDGRCAALFEALAPAEEVDSLGCECGCALQVIGWPIDASRGGDGSIALEPLGR